MSWPYKGAAFVVFLLNLAEIEYNLADAVNIYPRLTSVQMIQQIHVELERTDNHLMGKVHITILEALKQFEEVCLIFFI